MLKKIKKKFIHFFQRFKKWSDDLEFIDNPKEIPQLEELDIDFAIWSPRTGIFDSHAYMLSMLGDFESLGGTIVFNTEFVNAIENKCLIVSTKFNNEITKVTCNKIINSAGLFADRVARKLPQYNESNIPNDFLC